MLLFKFEYNFPGGFQKGDGFSLDAEDGKVWEILESVLHGGFTLAIE